MKMTTGVLSGFLFEAGSVAVAATASPVGTLLNLPVGSPRILAVVSAELGGPVVRVGGNVVACVVRGGENDDTAASSTVPKPSTGGGVVAVVSSVQKP